MHPQRLSATDLESVARLARRVPVAGHRDDHGLHQLQRAAGNRAVAHLVTVQRAAGPVPTPSEPDQPLNGMELGLTGVTAVELPRWQVTSEAATPGPGRRGRPAPTSIGSVEIESHYVPAGVHDMKPASNGTKRKLLVTPAVEAVVKAGEQEHADDFWWSHQLVAGEAARAVNQLAAQPEREAPNVRELNHAWRESLHDALSPKLRATADAADPATGGSVVGPWHQAVAALETSSLGRDTAGWHSMRSRQATAAERAAHHVIDEYLMVAVAGGEIGAHPSEARMRAALAAQPDRP